MPPSVAVPLRDEGPRPRNKRQLAFRAASPLFSQLLHKYHEPVRLILPFNSLIKLENWQETFLRRTIRQSLTVPRATRWGWPTAYQESEDFRESVKARLRPLRIESERPNRILHASIGPSPLSARPSRSRQQAWDYGEMANAGWATVIAAFKAPTVVSGCRPPQRTCHVAHNPESNVCNRTVSGTTAPSAGMSID